MDDGFLLKTGVGVPYISSDTHRET